MLLGSIAESSCLGLLQGFQWRNPHFMRYNDTSCQDFLQGTKQGVQPPHLRMVLDAAVVACLAQQAAADAVPASADAADGYAVPARADADAVPARADAAIMPASVASGDAVPARADADAVPAGADSGDAVPASADAAAVPASATSRDTVPASAAYGDAAKAAQQRGAQQAASCTAAGERAEQQPPAVLDAAADARSAVARGSSAGDGQWLSVFPRSMRDALDSSWTKKGLRVSELCGTKPCGREHCCNHIPQTALGGLLVTASAVACSVQIAERLALQSQHLPSHFFDVPVSTLRCPQPASKSHCALYPPLCNVDIDLAKLG